MNEREARIVLLLSLADRVAAVSRPENLDVDGLLIAPMPYDLNEAIEKALAPEDHDNRSRRLYASGYRNREPGPSYGSDIRDCIRLARRLRANAPDALPSAKDGGWIFGIETLADLTARATFHRLDRGEGFLLEQRTVEVCGRTMELALIEAVLRTHAAEEQLQMSIEAEVVA